LVAVSFVQTMLAAESLLNKGLIDWTLADAASYNNPSLGALIYVDIFLYFNIYVSNRLLPFYYSLFPDLLAFPAHYLSYYTSNQ
tara:strand:+ start:144 stop:395 length:252 start_codon:yes stop_codon:yes gene_type:complete